MPKLGIVALIPKVFAHQGHSKQHGDGIGHPHASDVRRTAVRALVRCEKRDVLR
jgi:hypothetical protein